MEDIISSNRNKFNHSHVWTMSISNPDETAAGKEQNVRKFPIYLNLSIIKNSSLDSYIFSLCIVFIWVHRTSSNVFQIIHKNKNIYILTKKFQLRAKFDETNCNFFCVWLKQFCLINLDYSRNKFILYMLLLV